MTHDFLDIDTIADRVGMTRRRVQNLLEASRKKGRPVARQHVPGFGVEYSWQEFKAAIPANRRHSDATHRGMARANR